MFNVDETKKVIRFKNTRLTLTRFEYGILAKLLSNPGQVFSRDSLLDQLWSDDSGASDRAINAEDIALLPGTLITFAMVTALMVVTRNIEQLHVFVNRFWEQSDNGPVCQTATKQAASVSLC